MCYIINRLWIIATILSGAIYFQEISNFELTQWIMFPIGIVITLLGLWLLSFNQNLKKSRKNQITPEEALIINNNNKEKVEVNSQKDKTPPSTSNKDFDNIDEIKTEEEKKNKGYVIPLTRNKFAAAYTKPTEGIIQP